MSTLAGARRAGRREWLGLAVLALPTLLLSIDLTVLYLAVPRLSADLAPSSAELLWIVDVYGFMLAGLLIPMGRLGDRIGRRRLLLAGSTAFGLASVLAAFSTGPELLIAARAVLGVAGAALMPATMALLRTMFQDPQQRTVAIGVWAASYAVGAAVGPLLGGALLEHFWWGSAFLLAVPVMVLLVAAGPVLLPEDRDPQGGRVDLGSVAMSLVAVLAVIYAVKRIATGGRPDLLSALLIAAGVAVGVAFVRRQRRLTDPLVDIGLFANRAFTVALLVNTGGVLVMVGTLLFTTQYLQLALGLSPLEAGLWLLPQAAAQTAAMVLTPALLRWLRPSTVASFGFAVGAVGFGMLALVDGAADGTLLVAASVVANLGIIPVFALSLHLVLDAAPPERAGVASGLSETGSELGGALGIALLGSIGTAVYRGQIDGRLPAGLPAGTAEAARDTLGGALAASGALPQQLAGPVLDAARDAFVSGLRVVAVISIILAATLSVAARALLRLEPDKEGT